MTLFKIGASNSMPASARDFQPDALAIEDRPVPPPIRLVVYAIVLLVVCGVIWAAVGKIDVLVRASGRIVTDQANLVVQPIETSLIREIHIQPGQAVRKGEVLVTLDPTFAQADETASRSLLDSIILQAARLEAEMHGQDFTPDLTITSSDAAIQLAIHQRRITRFASQIQSFDEELNELRVTAEGGEDEINTLKKQLRVVNEVVEMRRQLMKKEFGSRLQWLDSRSRAIQIEAEIEKLENAGARAPHSIARVEANRAAFIADWRRETGEEFVNVRRELDRLSEQVRKLERRRSLISLKSPADGVVLEIAERSVGSVVREAEPLITLVPTDVPLELEVDILPRDIGRVKIGDSVRIKLEAVPFQKHGTMDGEIAVISEDTFEKRVGASSHRVYRARISIVDATLTDPPDGFRLLPGMNVTAEIHVGQRTILSYLVYPITRGLDESMREP